MPTPIQNRVNASRRAPAERRAGEHQHDDAEVVAVKMDAVPAPVVVEDAARTAARYAVERFLDRERVARRVVPVVPAGARRPRLVLDQRGKYWIAPISIPTTTAAEREREALMATCARQLAAVRVGREREVQRERRRSTSSRYCRSCGCGESTASPTMIASAPHAQRASVANAAREQQQRERQHRR